MSVNSKMRAIADAIREKAGISGSLTLDQMAEELRKLKPTAASDQLWIFKSGSGAVAECSNGSQMSSQITVAVDSIDCSFSDRSNSCVTFCTNAAIDLTRYSKMCVEASVDSLIGDNYWDCRFGIAESASIITGLNQGGYAAKKQLPVSERTGYELDISDFTGLYYVGFSGAITGKIYNIWLE